VERSVTRARVPSGQQQWAAVSAFSSKRSPLAVVFPWNPGPYQEASASTGPEGAGGGKTTRGR
jgi:hypothetical protein